MTRRCVDVAKLCKDVDVEQEDCKELVIVSVERCLLYVGVFVEYGVVVVHLEVESGGVKDV